MFVNWLILLFPGIVSAANPQPIKPLFLTEPLNTGLFFVVGAILAGIIIVRRLRNRAIFQRKVTAINTLNDFIDLTPGEFEDAIVELYKLAGHDAKRTGSVGDHGVDIVVNAKDGQKWVVQCKRWQARATVGEPVLRDFYGAVQHEKADKGIVITTGRFSKSAKEWAKGKPIDLYDGERFIEIWQRAQQSKARSETNKNTVKAQETTP